jgi:hypothetical protein
LLLEQLNQKEGNGLDMYYTCKKTGNAYKILVCKFQGRNIWGELGASSHLLEDETRF